MQPPNTALPDAEGVNCCGCTYKVSTIPALTKKVGIVSIVLHIVGFLIGHVPFFVVNFSGPEWCVAERCADNPDPDSYGLYSGWRGAWCYSRQECRDFVWPEGDDLGSGYDDWDDVNEAHRLACICSSADECSAEPSVVDSCTQLDGFLLFVAIPTVIIWLVGLCAAILILPKVALCDPSCASCTVVGLAITAAVLHGLIGLVEALMFWTTGLQGDADWVAGLLLLKNLMCLVSEIVCAVVACGVKSAYDMQAFNRRRAEQQQLQMQQMQQMMAMGMQPGMVQPGMPMQPGMMMMQPGMQPVIGQPAAGFVAPQAEAGPSQPMQPVVAQAVSVGDVKGPDNL